MTITQISKFEELEKNCNTILRDRDIKFIGIINKLGNLIAGGFRKGVTPIGSENVRKMMYMAIKLDLDMRKDYDDLYGPVSFVISKRSYAQKISIPIRNHMVLVITELNYDNSQIEKFISIFEPTLKDLV